MPLARLLATAAALVLYALLSHALMVHAPNHPWTVAALFGPLWAVVSWSAWRQRQWAVLALCAAVATAIVAVVGQGGVRDVQLMYVLQHTGVHLALAGSFAATLRPGQVPLITALAERVHTHFPPPMRLYTRQLTGAWVAYFLGMILISWVLYTLAPWSTWSLFCNLLTPLAAASFFVTEHLWRYWRHPDFERVSLGLVAQAWRTRTQAGTPAGPAQ